MGSAERARRTSVEPLSGPLEPWIDGELGLKSYHKATKRVLRMEIVEGMFTEEMGYSGMTMSTLEDQIKVEIPPRVLH